jgi:hypothetical protein
MVTPASIEQLLRDMEAEINRLRGVNADLLAVTEMMASMLEDFFDEPHPWNYLEYEGEQLSVQDVAMRVHRAIKKARSK